MQARRAIRIAGLLLTASALAGCAGDGYYAQSIEGHFALMGARENVDTSRLDRNTPLP